jgi:hypothetical protein
LGKFAAGGSSVHGSPLRLVTKRSRGQRTPQPQERARLNVGSGNSTAQAAHPARVTLRASPPASWRRSARRCWGACPSSPRPQAGGAYARRELRGAGAGWVASECSPDPQYRGEAGRFFLRWQLRGRLKGVGGWCRACREGDLVPSLTRPSRSRSRPQPTRVESISATSSVLMCASPLSDSSSASVFTVAESFLVSRSEIACWAAR